MVQPQSAAFKTRRTAADMLFGVLYDSCIFYGSYKEKTVLKDCFPLVTATGSEPMIPP